ncbi:hypothetical protein CEXT_691011 [Caerostris extrusa]|uniref:Uncharacterized protein n=1 Tax=Caerostris extrusa TaxID=172846 RepID=A0AAV4MD88_CAEEX|nr:hypothetical protein CEXT_691011 [Caerostris extrusa]
MEKKKKKKKCGNERNIKEKNAHHYPAKHLPRPLISPIPRKHVKERRRGKDRNSHKNSNIDSKRDPPGGTGQWSYIPHCPQPSSLTPPR